MAIPAHRGGEHDTLLSVAQAAAWLGVHPNTIRAWAEAGRLPAYRINPRGDRRFRSGDVERLLGEGAATDEASEVGGHEAAGTALEALAMIARGAASATSAMGACRAAVEALRTHAGHGRVAIYLLRDDELSLATHGGYRVPPPTMIEPPPPGDAAEPAPDADRHELPLVTGGELLGVLVVEPGADAPSSTTQPSFLRAAAGSLAAALHNTRLLARARRELKRARALRAVTQELTGQLDLGVVLEDIVERTRSLFEADKAGLWLVDDREHPFELAAAHGIGPEFVAEVRNLTMASDTLGIRALRDRRAYVMRNADIEQGTGLLRGAYAREGMRTVCLVPLLARDEALGLLGLYHDRDRAWPDAEVALVQAFANQAAVAISNARLYHSVADQAARMRSIQDLSARLNRLTDVRAIAEAIVAEARTLADYNDIRIYTIDWETRTCEPVAFTKDMLGEGGDYEARLRVSVGEGSLTGWVAEHGEPILVNDALHDPRAMTIEGTDDIEESMLVVPMLYEGHAVGIIVLSQLGFDRFTQDDLQTVTIFAGYAAQAIANAAAYERLELQSAELARQLDSQRRLLEINERLLSTLDSADVLETIADGLRSVVSYDNLSIYRADHTAELLVPVFTREQHAEEVSRYNIPFGSGLMGWVVDHGEPVLANDALSDPRALQIPGTPPDPEAVILVPLVSGGSIIGAVNVSRIGGEEVYFSAADFELVKLFAGQASIALRNADEHRAVSQRAETDALTGLGNHGAFQRDLGRLLDATDASAPAATHRVAMLMMDLDQFKSYNDRLGHPAGDALLHAVGGAISGAARSDDRVYRYGGDEFALILPAAGARDATRVGDRVRRAVARLTAHEPSPVTITVGLAVYPDDAADRGALVAAADTALYYGKQSGEDRVVRADRVPREMHDLRGRLHELAKVALQQPDEGGEVQPVEPAAAAEDHGPDSLTDLLLRVARSEAHGGSERDHAARVGWLALQLAARLGCDDDERRAVELAGRLHGLDAAGLRDLDALASLRGVSRVMRGHLALLAGRAGRRRTDPELAVGAHILGVAHAYDELMAQGGDDRPSEAALVELRGSEIPLRSDVVDALADLVGRPEEPAGDAVRGQPPQPELGAA